MKKITSDDFVRRLLEKFPSYPHDISNIEFSKYRDKINLTCQLHGVFETSPVMIYRNGNGCKMCARQVYGAYHKLNKDTIVKNLKDKFDKLDYSLEKFEYTGSKNKSICICDEHGEFLASYEHLIRGQGCPKCRYIKSANKTRLSFNQFTEKLKNNNISVDLSKFQYKNFDTKSIVVCPIHGEYLISPANLLKGIKCKRCAIDTQKNQLKNKYTTDRFLNTICERTNNSRYDLSKFCYTGWSNKSTVICKKHGEFLSSPAILLQNSGCPKCAHEKMHFDRKYTLEQFLNKAKINLGDQNLDEYVYMNWHTPSTVICSFGHKFLRTPSEIYRGGGCPICRMTKYHKKLYDYLKKTINIDCDFNNRKVLSDMEIDIFIEKQNIGIEINGEFWHSFDKKNADRKYHIKKTNRCLSQNIVLLQFWEHELKNKISECQSIINYHLGISSKTSSDIYIEQIKTVRSTETHKQMQYVIKNTKGETETYISFVLKCDKLYINQFFDVNANPTNYLLLFQFVKHKFKGKTFYISLDRRFCLNKIYEDLGFSHISTTLERPIFIFDKKYNNVENIRYDEELEKLINKLNNEELSAFIKEQKIDIMFDCGYDNMIYENE